MKSPYHLAGMPQPLKRVRCAKHELCISLMIWNMVWNTKLSWFVRVGGLVMPFSCKVHPFHEDVVAKLHVYVSYLSGTTRDLNRERVGSLEFPNAIESKAPQTRNLVRLEGSSESNTHICPYRSSKSLQTLITFGHTI